MVFRGAAAEMLVWPIGFEAFFKFLMLLIYPPRVGELHISWFQLQIEGLPFLCYVILLGILLRYSFGDFSKSLALFFRLLPRTQSIHLNPLLRTLYTQRSTSILLLPVFQYFDMW